MCQTKASTLSFLSSTFIRAEKSNMASHSPLVLIFLWINQAITRPVKYPPFFCASLFSVDTDLCKVSFTDSSETTGNLGIKNLEIRQSLASNRCRGLTLVQTLRNINFSNQFHCCCGGKMCSRRFNLCGCRPSFNFVRFSFPSFVSFRVQW